MRARGAVRRVNKIYSITDGSSRERYYISGLNVKQKCNCIQHQRYSCNCKLSVYIYI